jgi:gliding motility-associated-like protein
MILKKVSVFLFFILLSLNSFATHVIGGEIYYECLGNDNYRITLKVYRDCFNGVPALDNPAYVSVFDNNGTVVNTIQFFLKTVTNIPPSVNNPCLVLPPDVCVEEGYYSEIVYLPFLAGGYTLSYQRCCRNQTILNIVNPGATGATYTTHIDDIALTTCNSNPHFKFFPPIGVCINDPLIFDHSAIDPDGDSLAYELCDPFVGADQNCPVPDNGTCVVGARGGPIAAPPYPFVIWQGGFSGNYPLTSSPALSIDPITGLLTGTPTQLGQYVVGVCVKEYRNGVLLSVNKRDFQFNVVVCAASVATVPNQAVYCDGLTVDFSNASVNASTYFWNFGDPNTISDTSNLSSPSYTYSDTGQYTAMLVINPGTQCVDTAFTSFGIYPLLPAIANFSNQCFAGNNFNFNASGTFGPTTTFSWNFGPDASPSTSVMQNPAGINYTAAGTYPVSVTMDEKGCSKTTAVNVEIYPQPMEVFTFIPLVGCAPYTVQYGDSSNTGNTLFYNWNFGSQTSSASTPVITYNNPGTYSFDLQLIAETSRGCRDTFNYSYSDVITVNPSPTAAFTVDNKVLSIFEPNITVSDSSSGAAFCMLDFGDGDTSSVCNILHTYQNPGKYTITQVVLNEFGCPDTFRINIVVENEYRFYVPNAFTPNGDGLNEVFKPAIMGVMDYTLLIFNRWGELIFETHDIKKGWDGYYKGELCPHEVYVYKINFLDLEFSMRHEFVGGVTLVR